MVAPNLSIDVAVTGNVTRTGPTNVMATVKVADTAVASVVKIVVKGPTGGNTYTLDGVTGTDGVAMVPFELTQNDPAGMYEITVMADKNGVVGTKTISVNIQ